MSCDGYGARRAGSFAGKTADTPSVASFVYTGDGKKRHQAQLHKGRPERNRTYELYETIRKSLHDLSDGVQHVEPDVLQVQLEHLALDAVGEHDLLYRIAALKRQVERYQAMHWQQLLEDDDDFMMMV